MAGAIFYSMVGHGCHCYWVPMHQSLLGMNPEHMKQKEKEVPDTGKKRSPLPAFGQVHYDPTSEDAARFELHKVFLLCHPVSIVNRV